MENTPFTSDELNYLIYRYLLENGFQHTAFAFSAESKISSSMIEDTMVPRGALISMVQKGLHFTEAEFFSTLAASSNEKMDALKFERVLGSIGLLDAILPDADRLKKIEQKIVDELGEDAVAHLPLNIKITDFQRPSSAASAPSTHSSVDIDQNALDEDDGEDNYEQKNLNVNEDVAGTSRSPRPSAVPNVSVGGHSGKRAAAAGVTGIDAQLTQNFNNLCIQYPNGKMLPNVPDINADIEMDRNLMRPLQGHGADVFIVSWNPKCDYFASGSGDSTARLWNGEDLRGEINSVVLFHESQKLPTDDEQKNKDVTSIHWNATGDFLATGCYDGYARLWDTRGNLISKIQAHKGPIFALKWNYSGNKVLSAGVDNNTVIWDPSNRFPLKTFSGHQQSALDVDWINDEMFASCSVDKTIQICQWGRDEPLKIFRGHENEVNAVKYDRVSGLLASCSDDRTLKIWNLDKDRPVYDVHAHDKEIYTIRWSPTGHFLASASFDHSVKIWDLQRSTCYKTLQRHKDSVYTVAFHQSGVLLASGSFDKTINIWDLRTGGVVMTYTGYEMSGGFFEVDWNRTGEKLAASAARGVLLLFDVRNLKSLLPS